MRGRGEGSFFGWPRNASHGQKRKKTKGVALRVQESLLLLSLSLSFSRPPLIRPDNNAADPSRPHCTRPSANSARFFPSFFPPPPLHPQPPLLLPPPLLASFGRRALVDHALAESELDFRKEGRFFARFLASARSTAFTREGKK